MVLELLVEFFYVEFVHKLPFSGSDGMLNCEVIGSLTESLFKMEVKQSCEVLRLEDIKVGCVVLYI